MSSNLLYARLSYAGDPLVGVTFGASMAVNFDIHS